MHPAPFSHLAFGGAGRELHARWGCEHTLLSGDILPHMRSRRFLFAALFALAPIAVLSATMASCSDPPPPPPRDSGPDTRPDYYVPPVEGGLKCDAGLLVCNNMCVDVYGNDPMNCGNCNKA